MTDDASAYRSIWQAVLLKWLRDLRSPIVEDADDALTDVERLRAGHPEWEHHFGVMADHAGVEPGALLRLLATTAETTEAYAWWCQQLGIRRRRWSGDTAEIRIPLGLGRERVWELACQSAGRWPLARLRWVWATGQVVETQR